jgi:anaerobic magnesium-protoporphyrin IX monomethyl ester cyclase
VKALFVNPGDTSRHVSSANTAIYPNLGLLTLMTALSRSPLVQDGHISLAYLDGTVCGNAFIKNYILENATELALAAFSSLTANHGAALEQASLLKQLNPSAYTIFGNDHFSALYREVMSNNPVINYGFYGNDVVEGFCAFCTDLLGGRDLVYSAYPGLVYRASDGIVARIPENPHENGNLPLVNYSLADTLIPHNAEYLRGQQRTYHFMKGRLLKSQVVDIGRGCVKFAGPRVAEVPTNACDFCGIIPGGRAISSISADRAWKILKNAYDQGYNYFYVTADELPLTLWPMLREMAKSIPSWYSPLCPETGPKMFGYARA